MIFDYQWLAIIGLSATFSLIVLIYYYRKDRIEPEPISRIALAFVLGILSTLLAFILSWTSLEILKSGITDSDTLTILSAGGIAPVVEEFSKLLMVIYLSKHASFDGPLDGLIYGSAVGAGFSFAENILYGIIFTIDEGLVVGLGVTVLRGAIQILGHPLYTGLAGVGVGMYKVRLLDSKFSKYWRSVFLHMIWNISSIVFPLGLIFGAVIGFRYLRSEFRFAQELDLIAYSTGYYARKEANLNQ